MPAPKKPEAMGCQGGCMVFLVSYYATMSSICIIFYSVQAGFFFKNFSGKSCFTSRECAGYPGVGNLFCY